MIVHNTPLGSLYVVESIPHTDERGDFARIFCEKELSELIGSRRIVQMNHSRTTTVGAVRGMHFQIPPNPEMKLVRCIKGRVWDVAVDLRKSSPTFLHWHAQELSPTNNLMMVIPEGFAHGFQVMEPDSELLYLHTAFYDLNSERGIKYDDAMLSIAWPEIPTDVSPRDQMHTNLDGHFKGIAL